MSLPKATDACVWSHTPRLSSLDFWSTVSKMIGGQIFRNHHGRLPDVSNCVTCFDWNTKVGWTRLEAPNASSPRAADDVVCCSHRSFCPLNILKQRRPRLQMLITRQRIYYHNLLGATGMMHHAVSCNWMTRSTDEVPTYVHLSHPQSHPNFHINELKFSSQSIQSDCVFHTLGVLNLSYEMHHVASIARRERARPEPYGVLLDAKDSLRGKRRLPSLLIILWLDK